MFRTSTDNHTRQSHLKSKRLLPFPTWLGASTWKPPDPRRRIEPSTKPRRHSTELTTHCVGSLSFISLVRSSTAPSIIHFSFTKTRSEPSERVYLERKK